VSTFRYAFLMATRPAATRSETTRSVVRQRHLNPGSGTGRWLTAKQETAWRAYRRMNRLVYARVAADLAADSGLSEADYDVLSNLTESGSHAWRFKELAGRLQWSASRLSHQLSRMEERGLLRRDECDDDSRGAIVKLSEAGWRTIQRAAPAHVESVRRHFIQQLSGAQLVALHHVAQTVVRSLSS
jgi:DNA-binding MarR family transcriptional regulator